jgi:hypothetical protein
MENAWNGSENSPNIEISERSKQWIFPLDLMDINQYGAFKANMMNGWASKAINTLDTINITFPLAGSWVKTNSMKTESRTAVT